VGGASGKFIETAFRRIRKYNGIAGIITQSFSDFERTPAAKAALENAAWQFLLFQKPESITAAIRNEWIPEGGYEEKLLRSVRPGDGFSEVLVRGEAGIGLYRLVLDRHSYYTFTTTATEITAINNLVKAGNTMAQAIDVLAHRDYAAQYGTAVADYLCGRGALPSEYAAN
jgi:conjugal transfer ATP-binding protein TraC